MPITTDLRRFITIDVGDVTVEQTTTEVNETTAIKTALENALKSLAQNGNSVAQGTCQRHGVQVPPI